MLDGGVFRRWSMVRRRVARRLAKFGRTGGVRSGVPGVGELDSGRQIGSGSSIPLGTSGSLRAGGRLRESLDTAPPSWIPTFYQTITGALIHLHASLMSKKASSGGLARARIALPR